MLVLLTLYRLLNILYVDIHILFNSMGSWYMSLSDYMGGRCLWKFNSMGGGGKKKVTSSPSRYFFLK